MLGDRSLNDTSGRFTTAIIAVSILYLIGAYALAFTRIPSYDEGQDANPSHDWIVRGTTGISALEPSGLPIPSRDSSGWLRVQQRNYTEMPVYLVMLTVWFRLFGFGLVALRSFTIWCGLAALLSWLYVVRRFSLDSTVTWLSGALVAIDYTYALRVSDGRMDALSAAFGFGGWAAYLYLRERHFGLAILVSHCCVSAAAFTHPNGGVLALFGLLLLTALFDFRRLRFVHLLMAAIPYLVGAVGWGLYIYQDVEAFRVQFTSNAGVGGRLQTFSAPFRNLQRELLERYLYFIGGWGDSSTVKKAKLIVLISYAAGFAGVAFTPALRRQQGYRILLMLAAGYFFILAFIDGLKSPTYIIYVIPLDVTLLASWIVWLWRNPKIPHLAIASSLAAVIAVHVGGIAYQVRQDPYRRIYMPVIRFLQQNARPDQLIMGNATFGIGLDYPDNLLDDIRLGMRSSRVPVWIVVDERYKNSFRDMMTIEPESYRFIDKRLADYVPAYRNGSVTVLRQASIAR